VIVAQTKCGRSADRAQKERYYDGKDTTGSSSLSPPRTEGAANSQRELLDIEPEAPEFEVEVILAHRGPPTVRQYLIKRSSGKRTCSADEATNERSH